MRGVREGWGGLLESADVTAQDDLSTDIEPSWPLMDYACISSEDLSAHEQIIDA